MKKQWILKIVILHSQCHISRQQVGRVIHRFGSQTESALKIFI